MPNDIAKDLIRLAADMARATGLPSEFDDDHLPDRPRIYWLNCLSRTVDALRVYALRVRAGADEIESLRSRLAKLQGGEACCVTHGEGACQLTCAKCNDELRSQLAEAEYQWKYWMGVADDNGIKSIKARLAEAESRLNLADAEVTMLRHFNAEADALLREARETIYVLAEQQAMAEFVWVRVDVVGAEIESLRSRLAEAEALLRPCPHCGMALALCYDAKRTGKIACCPDCRHDAHLAREGESHE